MKTCAISFQFTKIKNENEIWDEGRKLSKKFGKWTFNLIKIFEKYFVQHFLVNGNNDRGCNMTNFVFVYKLPNNIRTFKNLFSLSNCKNINFSSTWIDHGTKLIINDFKMRIIRLTTLYKKHQFQNWKIKLFLYWKWNINWKKKNRNPTHISNKAIFKKLSCSGNCQIDIFDLWINIVFKGCTQEFFEVLKMTYAIKLEEVSYSI